MSKTLRRWILSSSAIAAAAIVTLITGVAEPLRRGTGDLLLRTALGAAPAPSGVPDVAIAAIDPQSLRAYPEWPWPRDRYAELVDRLDRYGARAIGFDIDFSTPRELGPDSEFAHRAAASGRVALAVFRQTQALAGGAELEISNLPIAPLAESAAALGSVMVPLDPDGVVRRFPRSSRIGGRDMPSLAAATLAIALRQPPGVAPAERGRTEFALVDYRRARPPVPIFSVADLLEGRVDSRELAGRVVLVGATAAEFQDLWTTPIGAAVPGVLIQALALRTLAAEQAGQGVLHRPGLAWEAALLVLLSALAGGLRFVSHARRLWGLGLLGAGAVVGALALLRYQALWVDPVLPVALLTGHYVLGIEGVRRRFGRSLAEREHSLSALFRVGQATTALPSLASGGLDLALALLGDVVEASGVALLRASPSGELDGRRLEWTRTPGRPVGDLQTAERVLPSNQLRSFEGTIPGSPSRPGTAIYLPLRAGEVAVGVLAVERDEPLPLDATQLRTVATVGAQLALSAQNVRLLEDLHATFDTSIAAIASAIEARDGYTESHCRRLAAFSAAMAARIALPESEIEAIRLGALLHDVGKIGIRDEVLMKPGVYSADERREMERHAEIGHGIVGRVHGIAPTTLVCIRHHHERWDGRGYPDALAGQAIPLGARLVTVVDVWDALSTERPYKPALPQPVVRRLLEKESGLRFDPELLALFLRILDQEGEEMLAGIEGSLGRTVGEAAAS